MDTITQVLNAIDQGDPKASEQLLPLVYDELRKLAAQKLAQEAPGQTLQATALVHEAYLRLVGAEQAQRFEGRGHFFAAAAESMRRILVESARRKNRIRHGGGRHRIELDEAVAMAQDRPEALLALDEALDRFAAIDPEAARLVQLRFFAGLSMPEAATALSMTLRTAERNWTYARTWLRRALADAPE
jgi:RNA polymerase sigma factor (TIGR02999 family)